jgi:hypothetical protein
MINEKLVGTIAFGLRLPLIKEGDNLINAIVNSYSEVGVVDGDVVGVTESIVARNAGMYVRFEEVGKWLTKFKPTADHLVLVSPIFSRNRFIPILRGMLCAQNITKVTIMSCDIDEVGNTVQHQITGVNYRDIYKKYIEDAGKEFEWVNQNIWSWANYIQSQNDTIVVDCRLHANQHPFELSLQDIFKENNSWGLLGMNAAGDDRLKLFPDKQYAQYFVDTLQRTIKERFGKDVEVMIYGDGAFKDPVSGIWEWADPVVSPAWTSGLDGSPAEIKLKNVIDSGMSEKDIRKAIKNNRGKSEQDLGTTPRRFVDLFGSLMDLISGSGDKGTPVVIIRNSKKKYID